MTDATNCVIKTGFSNMDFEKVTSMLGQSYWCQGISLEEVKKGALNSALIIGVFEHATQIAFARVVSDKTRFAYILDVYVDEPYRGKGIGRSIIQYILNHDDLKDVYQWVLFTKDAHSVYSTLGFHALGDPQKWMEIRLPRPNR